jgi:chromosome partitioning protein
MSVDRQKQADKDWWQQVVTIGVRTKMNEEITDNQVRRKEEREMSRVLAMFNQSGGVGKTTLTMNAGYQLSQRGWRVLLVDLDPQASLSIFMGQEPYELEETIEGALLGGRELPVIRDEGGQLDLVPSNIKLSAAEMQLVSMMSREKRLKKVLEPVREKYDWVLIDCPPSLGILSVMGLVAASHVLVPIQTQFKAYKGTELLLDTIRQVKEEANPSLGVAGFVPMMYTSGTVQDAAILSALEEQLSEIARVYRAVPRSTTFADASMERQPLAKYRRKHPGVEVIEEILDQLEAELL